MNATNPLLRDAEPLSFAFLSTRAANALRRAIESEPLGPDEDDVLDKAANFLREISNGAQIAAHGTFKEGLSPTRSLAALDVAFGPIDALRQLVANEKDVAKFFEELSGAVESVRETGRPADTKNVVVAQRFFDALSLFVAGDLASRHPRVGARVGDFFN